MQPIPVDVAHALHFTMKSISHIYCEFCPPLPQRLLRCDFGSHRFTLRVFGLWIDEGGTRRRKQSNSGHKPDKGPRRFHRQYARSLATAKQSNSHRVRCEVRSDAGCARMMRRWDTRWGADSESGDRSCCGVVASMTILSPSIISQVGCLAAARDHLARRWVGSTKKKDRWRRSAAARKTARDKIATACERCAHKKEGGAPRCIW